MKFNPAELLVKQGDKVLFHNKDIVIHDVTEDSDKLKRSPALPNGKSWEIVATHSLDYHCSFHSVMKGKIRVEK